jgi:dienelactone hydrolase
MNTGGICTKVLNDIAVIEVSGGDLIAQDPKTCSPLTGLYQRKQTVNLSGIGPPIELDIYPGAYHAFDDPEFTSAKRVSGHINTMRLRQKSPSTAFTRSSRSISCIEV